jgi:hypothetical protein
VVFETRAECRSVGGSHCKLLSQPARGNHLYRKPPNAASKRMREYWPVFRPITRPNSRSCAHGNSRPCARRLR